MDATIDTFRIEYDTEAFCFVGTDLDGNEVFGNTYSLCLQNVSEHNRAIIRHRQVNDTAPLQPASLATAAGGC